MLLIYVLTTSAALVLLKLSSKGGAPVEFASGKMQLHITLLTSLGVLLYGASFVIYTYLISKFDLGYIIPLTTALVYVLIFFASFIVFKEAFNILKILGIVLIVIGLALLNLKK
jgi:drug/metabolite transporter (DMT)-like permease